MTSRSRARRNAARNRAFDHDLARMAVVTARAAEAMRKQAVTTARTTLALRRLRETS